VALKIEPEPNERVILGNCVVTNADRRAGLVIDGDITILREKDIMLLSRADRPAKPFYLAVQFIYTAKRH
jgi:flagellar biosynthesis repressor protein FlbT